MFTAVDVAVPGAIQSMSLIYITIFDPKTILKSIVLNGSVTCSAPCRGRVTFLHSDIGVNEVFTEYTHRPKPRQKLACFLHFRHKQALADGLFTSWMFFHTPAPGVRPHSPNARRRAGVGGVRSQGGGEGEDIELLPP